MRPPIDVVSGIIENGRGLVLIAQRPEGKPLAGFWEFPGGKIEAGESLADALKRELQEELCLDIEVGKSLGAHPYTYDFGDILLHVFIVRALSAPEPTADVQVFKWVDPRTIDFETLAPADREPLVQYFAQQSRPGTE